MYKNLINIKFNIHLKLYKFRNLKISTFQVVVSCSVESNGTIGSILSIFEQI